LWPIVAFICSIDEEVSSTLAACSLEPWLSACAVSDTWPTAWASDSLAVATFDSASRRNATVRLTLSFSSPYTPSSGASTVRVRSPCDSDASTLPTSDRPPAPWVSR